MGVGDWFSGFCTNLRMSADQRSSFAYRTARITKVLNLDFRNTDSDSANRFYVGSMGRNTAIPSVSDVDLLYVLPANVYNQYNAYTGNKQSALLSSVKTTIRKTYKTSDVFGDGQVVVIAFDDGVTYELLPAFLNTEGGYTFADTNGGGCWRACKPKHEMDAFAGRNLVCNGNLIELARMARAWRDYNNVPMSGMLIDTLAYQFIETWSYREKSYLYYDFMTRDFFGFLAKQNATQQYWLAPGSASYVYRKGAFEYKARQAELRALEALTYQQSNHDWSAKQKYREIYGTAFPA
ncbi:nucleotidyltransferase [Ralstonia solanacearum]|uniref:Nucleotidyltransferase n=1 Tax=Ralstonia solanacearum TaxID=305 RepID=A0AAE3NKM2_RALSL|nr:nucleotidyltransferase [Ralstonia solanacearum]MBB6580158.1 nucleotidyltransferase [Ralstonia solanacearum]MDB0523278.1 nucleotidyltransferase [Ralstonia solanacearum]